ncbi:MAG TPA: DUF6516 family protein [Burkholderiales bacterium]
MRELAPLLELHGEVIAQEHGYWVAIEAWRVDPTPGVPHGIRYSLTLHAPDGTRVLGYDNAHAVRTRQRPGYHGRIVERDHRHRHAADRGVAYTFSSAARLLEDFFADVDRILKARE